MELENIKQHIHVNIPFAMLKQGYLDQFVSLGLNPEIGLDANALISESNSVFYSVKSILDNAGLCATLHSPFIDLSPGSPDPEVRELTKRRFEQVLKIASIFKPKAVVFHVGYDARRYGFIRKAWIENSLNTWKWLAQRLMDENIQLSLENVYEDGPDDILFIFEALEGFNVKFCFDIGHHAAFGKSPMSEWLNCLGDYIGHLHLHDNTGIRDDHLGLGLGSIDFEMLFSWLGQKFDSPPIITIEPHSKEGLQPSIEFLKEHWPWRD